MSLNFVRHLRPALAAGQTKMTISELDSGGQISWAQMYQSGHCSKSVKIDLPVGEHDIGAVTRPFAMVSAVWAVAADMPDGAPCTFVLDRVAATENFYSTQPQTPVVLGYFNNNVALLDCPLLCERIRSTRVVYSATVPTTFACTMVDKSTREDMGRITHFCLRAPRAGVDSLTYFSDQVWPTTFWPRRQGAAL